MSSNEQRPRHTPTAQSIPLQDLSRPPDAITGGLPWTRRGPERSSRALRGNAHRGGLPSQVNTAARSDHGASRRSGGRGNGDRLAIPHIQTPRNTHQRTFQYDDGELSPVNIGDFQTASIGLSFDHPMDDEELSPTELRPMGSGARHHELPTSYSTGSDHQGGGEEYFPPNDDQVPLNDTRYLQPISGSSLPQAPGQRHDRRGRSGSSTSFMGRMLGDDLGTAENGSTRSASRSLSVSAAPFSSASALLRKMSQRVVNLSNEPEPVEQEMHMSDSGRGATLDAPPSFPAMTEYAHDDPGESSSSSTPPEKNQASVSIRTQRWQNQSNPLRGSSLGIFAPESPLRLRLCEMLVHPITEPLILVLIVLQTIILSIDAAPSLFYGESRAGWSETLFGWILVGLFVIYTLEIIAKTIVSGFILNADEYSTRPGETVWRSLHINLSFLFGSPRNINAGTRGKPQQDFQPSILRSFTSIQQQQDPRGHGRQAQRYRLARRAFLRHSFNRIDFVSVVSFWLALALSLTGLGQRKHIYVFQMLSCSRILRLLNLTSGTSVRQVLCHVCIFH